MTLIIIGIEVFLGIIVLPLWLAWPWIGPQQKGK